MTHHFRGAVESFFRDAQMRDTYLDLIELRRIARANGYTELEIRSLTREFVERRFQDAKATTKDRRHYTS